MSPVEAAILNIAPRKAWIVGYVDGIAVWEFLYPFLLPPRRTRRNRPASRKRRLSSKSRRLSMVIGGVIDPLELADKAAKEDDKK